MERFKRARRSSRGPRGKGSFVCMIQFHCYPGGKKRVVTFSYDDGHKNDERLVALFNRYGVKGTFHINGADFSDERRAEMRCV